MRAIEMAGTIDAGGQLLLETSVPLVRSQRVRVLILVDEEVTEIDELDEKAWLSAASRSTSFDFLNDPSEHIYTRADGETFNAQG